jgi:hypothetical protein
MKKTWDWLNGNKTIIFNTSAALLQQMVLSDIVTETKGVKFTIGVLFVFGGGSLAHHIKKGFFSRKKGH